MTLTTRLSCISLTTLLFSATRLIEDCLIIVVVYLLVHTFFFFCLFCAYSENFLRRYAVRISLKRKNLYIISYNCYEMICGEIRRPGVNFGVQIQDSLMIYYRLNSINLVLEV